MMRDRPINELKRLARQQGPDQYLALDELARRLHDELLDWWDPTKEWVWNPLEITRPPKAIEVEWALLKLSQLYNEGSASQGRDYELIAAQDKRLERIEKQLDQVEGSLEMKFFNHFQKHLTD